MTVNSEKLSPLDHFLVKIPKKFKDTIEIAGQSMYLETKFNEFENRYCYGEVVAIPSKHETPVQVGDTLYFHHHVVMDKNASIGDDVYIVKYSSQGGHSTQAYAYSRGEETKLFSDWVFVDIDKDGESKTDSGIILLSAPVKSRMATVLYDSDVLAENGIYKGDRICYSINADYEMEFEGKTVYRMRIDDILYVEEKEL